MGLVSVYINTLTLYYNIASRDMKCLAFYRISCWHNVDSVMLIRPDEQEIAGMLEALAKQMCPGGWRLKLQNPSTLMNYLGIQTFGSEES